MGEETHMLQSDKTPATTGEWECMECGHILEGTELERPSRCPECNAASEAFEFFAYEDEEWEGDLEDEEEDEDEDLEDELDDFEDLDDEGADYDEVEDEDIEELEDDR
jgi:predicted  nucleic acid-binding Zn-ribbon protein